MIKAIVVYESLWGNTAAVARAIAEGIGPEARALSTAEAGRFVVTGTYGPPRKGELERARQWGAALGGMLG